MSLLPRQTVKHACDTSLGQAAQRATRRLARRFGLALNPLKLTNGQFSPSMTLNPPQPPPSGGCRSRPSARSRCAGPLRRAVRVRRECHAALESELPPGAAQTLRQVLSDIEAVARLS